MNNWKESKRIKNRERKMLIDALKLEFKTKIDECKSYSCIKYCEEEFENKISKILKRVDIIDFHHYTELNIYAIDLCLKRYQKVDPWYYNNIIMNRDN